MKVFPISIVLIVLIPVLALAQTEYPEISCEDCATYFGSEGYCNPQTDTCFLREETAEQAPAKHIQPSAQPTSTTTATDSSLANLVANLQKQVAELENDYSALQTAVAQLQENAQQLPPSELENVHKEIKSVSTGLAGLQESFRSTEATLNKVVQQREVINTILTYTFLGLLGIAIIISILYSFKKKKAKTMMTAQTPDPEIVQYITKQVKAGKKYPAIKESLLNVGWDEQDIAWAYQETMKHNYKQYLQKNPESKKEAIEGLENIDKINKTKVLIAIGISILVIIGALLVLRGISAGKAVYFATEADLRMAMQETLEERVADNPFYSLLSSTRFCIQVRNGNKDASVQVEKTATSHVIAPAPKACADDPSYDVAIKFLSWNNFDDLSDDLTCNTMRSMHQNGVYVLPSRLVLPGFAKNPTIDYTQYCSVLQPCLSTAEMALVGC